MTAKPRRDRREPLSREKIVDKALEILDSDGIEGISMRRLGDALGVEAMALYHHFPNKDALLDRVLARVFEEAGPPMPLESADWKTVMASGPASAGRAIAAHPNAGALLLGRNRSTVESVQMLEGPLSLLQSAGFEGQELVNAVHAIFAYTVGWYFLSSGQGAVWGNPDDAAIEEAADSVPLTAAYAQRLRDWGQGMEEGLLALLNGLEARRGRG